MNAPQLKTVASLESLCDQYLSAKAKAKEAADYAASIEAEIVAQIGAKEEGSLSVAVADRFKITTTGKLTRAVDSDSVSAAWHSLPPTVQAAFRFKADLDLKQYRALEAAAPEHFKVAAQFVTTKPAKPSLKIDTL